MTPNDCDFDAVLMRFRSSLAELELALGAIDLDAMVADLSVTLRYESLDT